MLRLELENIGIIKTANLELPGLTVITGKNSSGKSTIGKALYSVVDGTLNISEKYEDDRNTFLQEHLSSVERNLSLGLRLFSNAYENVKFIYEGQERIVEFITEIRNGKILKHENWIQYLELIIKEVCEVNTDEIYKRLKNSKNPHENFFMFYSRDISKDYIEKSMKDAITELQEIKEKILNDPGIISFAKGYINRVLQIEYSRQIQPLRWKADKSRIRLYDDKRDFVNTLIKDNKVCMESIVDTQETLFDDAFLIDDPMIMDDFQKNEEVTNWSLYFDENMAQMRNHKDKLMDTMRYRKEKTVWEQTIDQKEADEVEKRLQALLHGEFAYDEKNGSYFVYANGNKLKLTNMATGSKTIAILDILLKRGAIRKNTLLIFDEPESHLHPEWQNELAEIMILLVKILNIKVMMTTHSANFLYALETFAMKHGMSDKCAYYQVEMEGEGAVCKDVRNNIELIYSDFLQYLTKLKIMRGQLGYHEELNDD